MKKLKLFFVCLCSVPVLVTGAALAQEAETEPVFSGTPTTGSAQAEIESASKRSAGPAGPEYDEAGNRVPTPKAWAGPVVTPRQLANERATVDEYEAMLGSAEMSDRLHAVTNLANLADRAFEPVRVRSLLETARSDRDNNVAMLANTSVARLAGIQTRSAAEHTALAVADAQASFDEYSAMLGSADWNERLHAVGWFANEAGNGNEQAKAALVAAQADQNVQVSAQAGAAVAVLAGTPTRTPQQRAASTLANDQETFAEYTAMLSDPEIANRLLAVGWFANEADNGNMQAEAALRDARRAADPVVAAEVDAVLDARAARGRTAY